MIQKMHTTKVFQLSWPPVGRIKKATWLQQWLLYAGGSPKGQVGEEGDRQEDGRDSTANIRDEGKDGGLESTGYSLSGEVLWEKILKDIIKQKDAWEKRKKQTTSSSSSYQ